ncbi:MAG TPA: hypothetical protein ACFYD1_07210, partial [Candidatus Hypogeohydataceae bacterium YC38]
SALVSPPNGHSPVVKYSVTKNTKYFSIRENNKFRLRTTHRWPLYIYVMMGVRDSLYLHVKDYIFLHSGAVAKGRKALLLPGPSGSGKSTLTLALLNYGYKYITDEVTVITPSSLAVMPFQRPIYVYKWLPPVSPAVKENFRLYRSKERWERTIQPWQFIFPQGEAILPKHSRFEVGWIIFPRYNETQKGSHLRPIGKAEAVFALMQRYWNIPSLRDWGLKACSEMVKRAECYRLETGDLREACELVQGLMGKTSGKVETKVLDNIWQRKKFM